MNEFLQLDFCQRKTFCCSLRTFFWITKVWDIEEAIRDPTPDVIVCLPSPCWSIQTGDRLFGPNNYVQLIHSTHHDYQMILHGSTRNVNEVNIYIFWSTKDQVGCSNTTRCFFFFILQMKTIALNFFRSENADLNEWTIDGTYQLLFSLLVILFNLWSRKLFLREYLVKLSMS